MTLIIILAVVALVAIAGVAVMTRPAVRPLDIVPSLVAAAAAVGALVLLARQQARASAEPNGRLTD